MKIEWSARQILALLLLAVVLVSISGLLEMTYVMRMALDGVRSESALISQSALLQIGWLAGKDRGEDLIRRIRSDPRLPLVMQAATAQAPAVVFVAICDSSDVVIASTERGMVDRPADPLPPLPEAKTLQQTLALFRDVIRSADVYQTETPLLLDGTPFATIRIAIASVLLKERMAEVARRGALAAGFQLGLALLFGLALAYLLTRRLRQFETSVAAMREGRYESRIPEGVDEFSQLARDLNLLSEQFSKESADREHLGSFRKTVELLGEGVLTLGPRREIVLINATTAGLLGIDLESSRGKRIDELLAPDHPVRVLADRLYDNASPEEGTFSVPLPPSGNAPAHVAIGHRITGADAPAGVLIEFKETTALEELHLLIDHSKVLTRLGQMAAGVAHEIRNPLQTINLELGILRQSRNLSMEEVDSHVRTAQDEIQRLQRAVSGFLKVARLRQLVYAPLDVNDLLEEIQQGMEAEANLAGLELEFHPDPAIPETQGDRSVLRQAVENVVRNAIQALPSREGRVLVRSRTEGNEIQIVVSDTGPGIPPEHLDKVADLYFTTRGEGTGVGLALVMQAMHMHAGDMKIESRVGEGTSVTLRVPVRLSAGRGSPLRDSRGVPA
ncbi:MAG: PAS domain-containing sensor histidine kinase [Candidatus Eisenbacteria bacterium]|nr:ATP-binding protein [Candidatus Eisenbacteria bacterium]